MVEEPCHASRPLDEPEGIELDEWLEEKIEQLRGAFRAAIAAGDDEQARLLVERFESSLDRLPTKQWDVIVAETTVWLGEEARALRRTPHDPGPGRPKRS